MSCDVPPGGSDGFFDDMTIVAFCGEDLNNQQKFINALLIRNWTEAVVLLDDTDFDVTFLNSFSVRRD